jgi:hypothetical protein
MPATSSPIMQQPDAGLLAQNTPNQQSKTRNIKRRPAPRRSGRFYNYLGAGLALWGESIQLLTSDGRSENVDVKYSGVALSYDLSYKIQEWAFWGQALAWFIQGKAVSEGVSITYEDKVASTMPLGGLAGVSYFPHPNVALSLGGGALLHTLKLNPPTSVVTSYDFKYSQALKPMYSLSLDWYLNSSWRLQEKLMGFVNNTGLDSAWNVSLSYVF